TTTTKNFTKTVGNMPGPLASGDFNKDGLLDVVVANVGDSTVQVLTNTGTMDFTVGSAIPVLNQTAPRSQPSAILTADLNKDGAPDVIVVSQNDAALQILLNDGTGTLVPQFPLLIMSAGPVGLTVGDLDGDGTPDIGVACQTAGKVEVLFNRNG